MREEVNLALEGGCGIAGSASVIALVPFFRKACLGIAEVPEDEAAHFFCAAAGLEHFRILVTHHRGFVINGNPSEIVQEGEIVESPHKSGFAPILDLEGIGHVAAVQVLEHHIRPGDAFVDILPLVFHPGIGDVVGTAGDGLVGLGVITHAYTAKHVHGELQAEDMVVLHHAVNAHHGILRVGFIAEELGGSHLVRRIHVQALARRQDKGRNGCNQKQNRLFHILSSFFRNLY